MRRLTLVISSLSPGGAERVLSLLANRWVDAGTAVTLLTWDDGGTPPFYELDPRVHHRSLGLLRRPRGWMGRAADNLRDLAVLRRALRESAPDAVVSFLNSVNVITLAASVGLGVPVVVSERSDPAFYPEEKIWRFLRPWVYLLADRLVVQTEGAKSFFWETLRRKTVVIPNPVGKPAAPPPPSETRAPELIWVGRLDPCKGVDAILRAFARLKDRHPAWSLLLVGDGPLREPLEASARALGLQGRVQFAGCVKDVGSFLVRADLFVMASTSEGFPNALCEAMAAGLPAVAADCLGVRAVVRDGIDGRIAPAGDEDALAEALDGLMGDGEERRRLGRRAAEVSERFSFDKVLAAWAAAFKGLGASSEAGR